MHKTIYIDIEEEIIGIINKIKKEDSNEIFLVVPKNSLLVQGIVNLKLLKKEVSKMGKKIILVTSDQHSKRIIKRVGLETKSKSVQDFVPEESVEKKEVIEPKEGQKIVPSDSLQTPKKRKIGSSSFYNQKNEEESLSPTLVREKPQENNEPKNTKLNISNPNTFGQEHIDNYEIKQKAKESPESNFKEKEIKAPVEPKIKPNQPLKRNSNSIDDFYRNEAPQKNPSPAAPKKPNKFNKKGGFTVSNKKRFGILSVVFLAVLFLIFSAWIFSSWPKMKVELILKEELLKSNVDLLVCENNLDCIPGNYRELIIETKESYEASGEKFSNDKGMSRGIVKIYNNYSSKDQALVATTRILSEDGKLFRLLKNTTVPGIENDKPGMVEAQVIADEIGQEYNIAPSKFTIEGFKGNDKYEKFNVISESAMTGGANDNENKKVKVVTEEDIDSAREKTIETFNDNLEENIKNEIDENEDFVLTSVEKEIIFSDSSYAPDDIIDNFDYTVREKVKLMTFDKTIFEEALIDSFSSEETEGLEFDKINKKSFEKDIADYDEKTIDLAVSVSAIFWPIIDEQEIIENLANEGNTAVQSYLANLQQIKKAIITYQPSWLSILPIKAANISIEKTKQ